MCRHGLTLSKDIAGYTRVCFTAGFGCGLHALPETTWLVKHEDKSKYLVRDYLCVIDDRTTTHIDVYFRNPELALQFKLTWPLK